MPSKRTKELKEKFDKKKIHSVDEAVKLVKEMATSKFDEAIELHVQLGIDPKKSDQQVRGTISFPHGIGKTKRIAAFVDPNKEAEAKEAGADIIGNEEFIAEMVQKGTIDFDVAVATPTMMPKLAKLARFLGPRGLMPNPKTDTMSPNVKKMIEEQKAGKESYKNDATSNIHQVFGRASMSEEQLKENLKALTDAIKRLKPGSSKGIYLKGASVASTMGPGIKVDIS
ncbi:MAG: 50S ribosomal protein L1 [Candidatus Uhrbacteria bacterium GW2011_GWE2_40_58]|nr:MAG: 50S ribosomal protein L1 [Candidatus Uhrbacteria bacterium GW2011_GWF2_40_263]KKR68031.1 MAG: 50S ribosomal protein L1 [Candidatus Uhrbacteria bacterium GW2011_GWE2_40_58]OGL92934.1 MAG: 50S ribosomal protein L1 [Candidatus Uhrbacteria bacterium RIFOXYA2_FULL_40_9]OGL97072.1 MAG: 50S ribosomal protein L1 [Candidatus Uhrbacteria bacterium RIFOXYB2_FULL_41_18]